MNFLSLSGRQSDNGYQSTLSRGRELITTFGIGFIARTIFQQLSKLGGVPGWILSAAIAAATTAAIGYAAMVGFAYGKKPTQETLQKSCADVTNYLKDQLMGLGEKKPDQGTLRQRIIQALNNLPGQLSPGLRTSLGAGESGSGSETESQG